MLEFVEVAATAVWSTPRLAHSLGSELQGSFSWRITARLRFYGETFVSSFGG
jgi:hypothetical protein